ncbi:MAG: CBS domain-containing protein [Candidatus Latescibacteria bacterium]|nr:CBS domain-containing protein [bacterium]MBD3425580.1 CBS domain-containing protein [Candidatus Latescibacterota bacterium]
MQIRRIMTEDVEVIQPDTLISDAAKIMRDLNVGVLPVTDGKALTGILTDRDIVVRSIAGGKNPDQARAGSIISENVAWCYENDEVATVSAKMKNNRIRRLPGVNKDNELVGIVSLGDLAVEGDEGMAGETLGEVSRPNRPER